ncbi:MAG: AAA family ATPase [Saprospiraceae bacterium]|nr:AAA family ATPase [Saprospiraceae bacterium]
MDEKMTGDLFIKSLAQIIRKDLPLSQKIQAEVELLISVCKIGVQNTGIQFHTVFSIIAYAGHQYNLPGRLLYNIYRFRRLATSILSRTDTEENLESTYLLGLKVLSDLIRIIYQVVPTPEILQQIPPDKIYLHREDKVVQFRRYQRVLAIQKEEQTEVLIAIDQAHPESKIKVRYNLPDRNELFNDSLDMLGTILKFPVELNLIDTEVDEDGYYLPRAIIIEPDFLIDITAVADCFKNSGISESGYFTRRFLPMSSSKSLMLGNIANFFLDELMANPDLSFKELINRVFQINPIAFSLFDDITSREIVQKAQRHYMSLKMVISQSFKKQGILVKDCFLEPTFYSEQYGLQGRLDVLYDNPEVDDDAAIVELKSGMPYRPNVYGLSHDHYVQTLLYDLLIKSASSDRLKPTNYILYSGKETDHLRFAPAVRSQQYEALVARNRLIAIDFQLSQADRTLNDPDRFLHFIREKAKNLQGYSLRDMNLLVERFGDLTLLEKKYFIAMMAMVAREYRLSKIGVEGDSRNNGQASLWLNNRHEKEEQFNILSNLQIRENRASENEPIIVFLRTEFTNSLANFRKGDLTIFYPSINNQSPLSSQLFKGTIIELEGSTVQVRLRAKQFNDHLFKTFEYWNMEHDSLDSGFNLLFRSLFQFTAFNIQERKRFLTLRPPAPAVQNSWTTLTELTEEQNRIMQKILNAQDYFLLWGPPGTGKTSIIVKHLLKYLVQHSNEQILLLAYTNRAVDEMCHALVAAGQSHFLRIGSRYSTHPNYVDSLLVSKTKEVTTRQQLRDIIDEFRIVAGTISSVLGKSELFELKQFDRLIIDEATQVLEPMVAGLLPSFKKVLLIGDHRQLAAVVTQPGKDRKVQDESLRAIGITDLGNSYFERIFSRCEEEQWTWAYDKLSFQGRMHQEVMQFPSEFFYQGMLRILPEDKVNRQSAILHFDKIPADSLSQYLAKRRVLFFAVPSGELFNSKVNVAEARMVGDILVKILHLHAVNHSGLTLDQVGIITPYRAQIAQIKLELQDQGINSDGLTIDTVERFQGGAKKIIIISLCINSKNQLDNLVSLSSDQVDRKLNVALTRAQDQVVMIGDPEILTDNAVYKAFIERYAVEQLTVQRDPGHL